MTSRPATRSTPLARSGQVYLRDPSIIFPRNKYPWSNEVFQLLLKLIKDDKISVADAINDVRKQILAIWSKSGLKLITDKSINEKLLKLYQQYQKLSQTRNNVLPPDQLQDPTKAAKHNKHLDAENEFKKSLDCLFDIKAKTQPPTVQQEDLSFYDLQTQPTRTGFISVIDSEAERKAVEKEKKEQRKRQRIQQAEQDKEDPMVMFASSSGDSQGVLIRNTRSGSKVI